MVRLHTQTIVNSLAIILVLVCFFMAWYTANR